ncbi:hypothetical protein C8R43DRAFT_1228911 [Mycena crocata]|nr:hypothetical protein C8R43DRAFT_1228911 [Mycena crocata]
MKFFIATVFAFSSLFLFVGGTPTSASMTSADVVKNIDTVTTVSAKITASLDTITTRTTLSGVTVVAKEVTGYFHTIIVSITADIAIMKGSPPFTAAADCKAIAGALIKFVQVHQLVLSTVIGKHSIFAQFGLTAPIAAVLRTLEGGIDAFAFALIALIPCEKLTVQQGQNELDVSVKASIEIYIQICTPSLFYPKVLPICFA